MNPKRNNLSFDVSHSKVADSQFADLSDVFPKRNRLVPNGKKSKKTFLEFVFVVLLLLQRFVSLREKSTDDTLECLR